MDDEPAPKRIRLNDVDLEKFSKDDLIGRSKKQEAYIMVMENKTDLGNHSAAKLSEMEDRLHQQQLEFARKERKDRMMVMRLAAKEQDLQELSNQLTEMTKGQAPGSSQLRSALLDPALNLIFQRMRKELDDKTKALQQAQDDMSAWKFSADSQMGKRLMSRCRTLIQENQELGKQVSAGRTARLETELALQKKYSEELKASQDELNDFVIELDEEVVGMQSTICALQQQLKEAKQEIIRLKSQATKPAVVIVAPAVEMAAPAPPPLAVNISSEQDQRTIEVTSKSEKRTDDSEKNWKDKEGGGAQTFNELTRQSVPEASKPAIWTPYERAGEDAAEKSPSTPTEEETFRIPEAPRTVETGPTSPAIPEEATSAPAPQEEAMEARTTSASSEKLMEESMLAKNEDEDRTFQVPAQPEPQVKFRTTDGEAETVNTTSDAKGQERTQEKMETAAEPEKAATATEMTPMETEPVPEQREAQEMQVSPVEEEEDKNQDNQPPGKSDDADAKEGNHQVGVSGNQVVVSSKPLEDSNTNAAASVRTTIGNTRTEEEEIPNQGTETTGISTNHNTKNGELSPTRPVSPPPESSDNNNQGVNNQGMVNSNCNVTNSPVSNNIVEKDGPSQSTEDGAETNSWQTPKNSESETTAKDAVAAVVSDRTNSPVKQILVKSNVSDSLIGGESEGGEKQQIIADVPPLKENGPEMVSN